MILSDKHKIQRSQVIPSISQDRNYNLTFPICEKEQIRVSRENADY